jgi:FkbH-like protein
MGMHRTALLSNVNIDFVIKSLRQKYEVFESAGYGAWTTYALNPQSSLIEFKPDTIFLILDGNSMISYVNTLEDKRNVLLQNFEYVDVMMQVYPDAIIFVSTIDVQTDGIFAADEISHSRALIWEWEQLLDARIQSSMRVHKFDLRNLIEEVGKRNMYSPKMWYMGGIPFDLQGMKLIAQEIGFCIDQLAIHRKKVLVVDLDNTLWGGVVGEDGYDQVVLGPSHIGAIYQDVQRVIKQMTSHGVLLAVISKNNLEDVHDVFDKNPHMILKKSDFVEICANWEEKSDNLRALAQKLNLGLDSFVFIDDNVVERESVRLRLPEVVVPDFPHDIAVLPRMILDVYKQNFWIWRRTVEDLQRTTLYQEEIARSNAHTQATSMEEYLRSLETVIRVSIIQPKHIERVHQLINKTNQFNTNTIRMDMVQLAKYCEESHNRVFVVQVSDRFGDAGLVAVVLLRINDNEAIIDNFLMSCRVMGRNIEHAVIAEILDYLVNTGVTTVKSSFVSTAKNKPVEDLWNRLGFTEREQDDIGKQYSWHGDCVVKPAVHTVIRSQ